MYQEISNENNQIKTRNKIEMIHIAYKNRDLTSFLKIKHVIILSISEKLPVLKFQYFRKYIKQLYGYFYDYLYRQRQTILERYNSSMSPVTMLHEMHMLIMFFAVIKNLKSSFSEDNMPVHALDLK